MACRVAGGVVDDAVRVDVLAREQRRPARRAQRRGRERIQEPRAFPRQPVDGRRLDERVAGEPEVVPARIVNQDDDDVRPWRLGAIGWRAARGETEDDGEKAVGPHSQSRLA